MFYLIDSERKTLLASWIHWTKHTGCRYPNKKGFE